MMAGPLKFGIFGFHRGADVSPEGLARRGRAAEAAGFESLWVGDHVVVPAVEPGSSAATTVTGAHVEDLRLEALIALTYLAAQTTTVRLGIGVIVVPQREPLTLAKQLASLDVLSGGRVIFGIGVGWLESELRALGVSMAERGARTDEYLAAMRAIWSGSPASYSGRFVSFENMVAVPPPLQQPHPPIVVGGYAPGALRRAIEQAHGWFGFNLDADRTAGYLEDLREAARRYERPAALGELEISVSVGGSVDAATAARYAALGVHRLILLPDGNARDSLDRVIGRAQQELIGRV